MSVTVDVNVLVDGSHAAAAGHAPARALLERLATGSEIVYLFWPVLLGYLRIVTHPGILPAPLAPGEAESNVEGLISRSHVRCPGEGNFFLRAYREVGGGWARGNDVPDAHLVALMRQNDVRSIYTRDRGFRRFDGIEIRDPAAGP